MIDHADLWLVRHGAADGKHNTNTEAQDFARVLSPKGARQAVRVGQVLAQLAPRFDACYVSPRTRCVQTANLIAPAINVKPDVNGLLDETLEKHPKRILDLAKDGRAVLLVGHGPEWKAVIRKLTGRDVWLFRGGICAITIRDGQATVTRLLQPTDVKALV